MLAVSAESLSHPQIFVIEDDPDHQKIAELTLRAAGISEVKIFGTGEEALDYFEQLDPRESLDDTVIFIDLMLPKISGFDILRRLQKDNRWQSSKKVVLSCSTSSEDQAMSRRCGADIFLTKPLQMDNLRKILSSRK